MFIDESRNARRFTYGPDAARGTPTELDIHHWGIDGQSHDGVVNFFCNTAETSAHFVVSAGRIHCLVNLTDVAWHAGDWPANLRSIGIECRPEATDADYATVAWLIAYLRSLYGDLPLYPHKRYALTSCPGRYDLARLDREARNQTPPKEGTTMANARDIWGYKNPANESDAWKRLTDTHNATVQIKAEQAAQRKILESIAKASGATVDYDRIDAAMKSAIASGIVITGQISAAAPEGK